MFSKTTERASRSRRRNGDRSFGVEMFCPARVSDQDRTDIKRPADVFFRNFDIKRPADKLLIYLTSYMNVVLKRLQGYRTLAEGIKPDHSAERMRKE
ncbi:Actin- protein 2/3 complex subunit 3 [Stylosanthes scabra]|uniref:Actin- protein 2/3 complex subunit 3 n=1 Tax=Stylosanthes scabra TaxID=79078 RepID=A0ABU6V9R3_9FABA|nr:Actin- protein 2/3 complex subunit 3 [Stylosanthes scabra]